LPHPGLTHPAPARLKSSCREIGGRINMSPRF
jgi:hypothetical protein